MYPTFPTDRPGWSITQPWPYEELAEATISEFVRQQLPDAHGWEGLAYTVTRLAEGVYRVEADIPMSTVMDCWLSFEVVDTPETGEPTVFAVHGIRNGTGDDEYETYTVDAVDGVWELFEGED